LHVLWVEGVPECLMMGGLHEREGGVWGKGTGDYRGWLLGVRGVRGDLTLLGQLLLLPLPLLLLLVSLLMLSLVVVGAIGSSVPGSRMCVYAVRVLYRVRRGV
jgi:hypothetical protein